MKQHPKADFVSVDVLSLNVLSLNALGSATCSSYAAPNHNLRSLFSNVSVLHLLRGALGAPCDSFHSATPARPRQSSRSARRCPSTSTGSLNASRCAAV